MSERDVLFVNAFIGSKQYSYCRELDSDLLKASYGLQSLYSAMLAAISGMAMDLALELHREKRKVFEPVVVDSGLGRIGHESSETTNSEA
jgi:hypothetical protein